MSRAPQERAGTFRVGLFVSNWDNITRTLELICVQVERLQVCEVADGCRDGTCAPVEHARKVPRFASLKKIPCDGHLCVALDIHTRARACQGIVMECEIRQLRQVADGCRDGACARAREEICV